MSARKLAANGRNGRRTIVHSRRVRALLAGVLGLTVAISGSILAPAAQADIEVTITSTCYTSTPITVVGSPQEPASALASGNKAGTYADTRLSGGQVDMAQTIANIGVELGISRRGIRIAIATAMQESSLNPRAVSGVYIGLYQQLADPSSGLYTEYQRTDAIGAIKMFYQQLTKRVPKYASDKRTDWEIAEVVQETRVGHYFEKWQGLAQELTDKFAPKVKTAEKTADTKNADKNKANPKQNTPPATRPATRSTNEQVQFQALRGGAGAFVALTDEPSELASANTETSTAADLDLTSIEVSTEPVVVSTDQLAISADGVAAMAVTEPTTSAQEATATSSDAPIGDTEVATTSVSNPVSTTQDSSTSEASSTETTAVTDSETATTAPVTTEPVTTEPGTTEPVTTGPVTTGPITTGPVTAVPTSTDPIATGPVTTDTPATTDPVSTGPATTQVATDGSDTTGPNEPTEPTGPSDTSESSPTKTSETSTVTSPTVAPSASDDPVDHVDPPVIPGPPDQPVPDDDADPGLVPDAPYAPSTSPVLGSGMTVATTEKCATAPNTNDRSTGFDPGYIISDEVFYNTESMSAAQIRKFIDDKGSECTDDFCLKNLRLDTSSVPADEFCQAYRGGHDEDVAAILARVSVACGINPQVMLVTLQKESGLLTRTDVSESSYNAAWGWHCPDTGPGGSANCDPQYAGFFNQAFGMAKQWSRYKVTPEKYNYRAGQTTEILWNVAESGCGGAPVTIKNTATASLYNYTPYQPNAAALASYPGAGDKCSAYGNRNFFFLYQKYFGVTGGGVPASIAIKNGVNVTIPDSPYVSEGLAGAVVKAPNKKVAAGIAAGFASLGLPYVWGGGTDGGTADQGCARGGGSSNSCDGIVGFDCSGLTAFVLTKAGFTVGTNSWSQRSGGSAVAWNDALPGDIIGYEGHVAIYLGYINGTEYLLEAPEVGSYVQIRPVYRSNGGVPVDSMMHRYWK